MNIVVMPRNFLVFRMHQLEAHIEKPSHLSLILLLESLIKLLVSLMLMMLISVHSNIWHLNSSPNSMQKYFYSSNFLSKTFCIKKLERKAVLMGLEQSLETLVQLHYILIWILTQLKHMRLLIKV